MLALTGLLWFLAPLKFVVPVNLQSLAIPPSAPLEWVFWAWPNQLAVMLAAVLLLALALDGAWTAGGGLLGWLVGLWLVTQALAMRVAICWQTGMDTLLHFAACAVLFYASARCAREPKWERWLVGSLAVATLLACGVALDQHFGGLEATRRFAEEHANLSEALRWKLTSRRVFGTFASPNSLAGFLALVFAPLCAWLWSKAENRITKIAAVAVAGGLMLVGVALSGSRGGCVALAVSGLTWLGCRRGSARRWVGAALLAALLVALLLKGGWLHLGSSSLAARWDYWGGAARIVRDYPWLGTGPGTFGSIYPKYKTAPTEEAQLAHNNFLQMASDSGIGAFVVFTALWGVGLWRALRLARQRADALSAGLAAALAAWTTHGLLDFDLYVPGVALPAFGLLGAVQGLSDPVASKADGRQAVPPTADRCRRVLVVLATLLVTGILWLEGGMLAAAFAFGKGDAIRAVQRAPRNPHYWTLLGDVAMQLGDKATALEAYAKAVDLDPMRPGRHVRLARAYWSAGKPAWAAAALRQAIALHPGERSYREELKAIEESVRQLKGGLLQSHPVVGERQRKRAWNSNK